MASETHGSPKQAAHDQTKDGSLALYAQLAAGMAIFGSGTPISKIVTAHFPVFIGSFLRVGLAGLILLPFLIKQREQLKEYKRSDWLVIFLIALIGTVLFSILMLYGMQHISGVAGSVVMSTTPAVTALGSFLFFHDKLGWRKLTAIALAVVGVLVLNLGGQNDADANSNLLLGIGMIFGAVCCEASYTLLGKKASDHVKPMMIVALATLMATAIFIPLALWQLSSFQFSDIALSDWAALGWWGVGTLALGSVLWYRGVAKVEGSIAAGFMGVMPVSALVLSYILLGEAFEWLHLLGFGLVFAGVLLISQAHAKMEHE